MMGALRTVVTDVGRTDIKPGEDRRVNAEIPMAVIVPADTG